MKQAIKFLSLLALLASSSVFADPTGIDLFDIRINNALFKQSKDLNYIVTLPKNGYWYTIENNNWKLIDDRVIDGKLKLGEWLTIRVYGGYDPNKNDRPTTGNAHVTLIDPANARVIWQGEFNYDGKSNQISAKPAIDNKKFYAPRLVITGGQYTADVDIFVEEKYSRK